MANDLTLTLSNSGGPDEKSPVVVAKGQKILFSVYLMHRRKDLWGEDVLEFKPGRWEQRIPAWQYLPFLGGPRICLGQQFALTEASYLLVRLLREYDAIEPVDWAEMRRLKKAIGVTMWPADGARVRFRKASSA
jgi:cytochrome P450